jgi:hypothetical protein
MEGIMRQDYRDVMLDLQIMCVQTVMIHTVTMFVTKDIMTMVGVYVLILLFLVTIYIL